MDTTQDQVAGKLKEIPKWTKKYSMNRAIPFILSMVIFLFLYAGMGISSYCGGEAYRSQNMPVFYICIVILIIMLVAVAFFSIPKWGGRFIVNISDRAYSKHGQVNMPAPKRTRKNRIVGFIVVGVFALCIQSSVVLGICFKMPIKYMQPISALYFVPFVFYIGMRLAVDKTIGWVYLLWSALYTVHAVLIVAGVPILFTGKWTGTLNMLIPVAGYGLLSGILAHLYSQHALRNLKKLTKVEDQNAAGDEN